SLAARRTICVCSGEGRSIVELMGSYGPASAR
ncbi:MAG: hypothetical protein ACI8WY_001029, partial [Planctomycetota bacterium]